MNNMADEFTTVSVKEAVKLDEVLDLTETVQDDLSDKQAGLEMNEAVDTAQIIDLEAMAEPAPSNHGDRVDLVDPLDDVIDLSETAAVEDLPADENLLETAMYPDGEEDIVDLSEEALPLLEDDGILNLEKSIEILPEQIEAALERVIRQKFSDKMDALVMKVIEEKVNREVKRVKALLLDPSPRAPRDA